MSGTHKYPTISFRISPREREEIEAKILASGMSKKDYFVRSCIYNRVCVVGRKELIYQLVEELKIMQTNIREVTEQFEQAEVTLSAEGLQDMRNDCLDMLKAILSFPFQRVPTFLHHQPYRTCSRIQPDEVRLPDEPTRYVRESEASDHQLQHKR